MKNLLLIVLILAGAGLYYTNKQQKADLEAAQEQNAQLTQQLADKTEALTALQAKSPFTPPVSQPIASPLTQPAQHAAKAMGNWTGSDPDSLDRPAYKN